MGTTTSAPSTGAASAISTVPGTSILNPWTGKQLQADSSATGAIRSQGQKYSQIVATYSATPVYGTPTTITFPVTNVGLITKFRVEVAVTITNPSGGSTLTRASMAPWNVLSNITYTDPANYQRINTTGFHMAALAMMRNRRIPGAALTTDSPAGFGSVLSPIAAPSTIAANASGTIRAIYEIPLAYSSQSFQGGVFAGAVFATQTLQLTLSPYIAQNGTDPLQCCYTGASNSNPPTFAASITIWQDYWDGFDTSLLSGLSPSLSTIYELKTSIFSNPLTPNFDNYFRYNNLRSFLSTLLLFDNGGTMNAGTDVNYFALQSANQTVEWKRDIYMQSYVTRQMFGDDFPPGVYAFDSRADPIATAAEGNTLLSMNPSSVQSGAYAMVCWESLATNSVLASAPSLAGTGGVSGLN